MDAQLGSASLPRIYFASVCKYRVSQVNTIPTLAVIALGVWIAWRRGTWHKGSGCRIGRHARG